MDGIIFTLILHYKVKKIEIRLGSILVGTCEYHQA